MPQQFKGYRDVVCLFGWALGDVGNLLWHLRKERSRDHRGTLFKKFVEAGFEEVDSVLAHCKSFRKCGLLLGAKLGEATS